MPIQFSCPRCERAYTVADALAGKRIKCKECGQEQSIPTLSAMAEPSLSIDDDDEEITAPPPPRGGRSPRPASQARRKTSSGSAQVDFVWWIKNAVALVGIIWLLFVMARYLLPLIRGDGDPPVVQLVDSETMFRLGNFKPEEGVLLVVENIPTDDDRKVFFAKIIEAGKTHPMGTDVKMTGSDGGEQTMLLQGMKDPSIIAKLDFLEIRQTSGKQFRVRFRNP